MDKVSKGSGGQTIMGHLSVRSLGNNEVIVREMRDVEYQVRSTKNALDSKIETILLPTPCHG